MNAIPKRGRPGASRASLRVGAILVLGWTLVGPAVAQPAPPATVVHEVRQRETLTAIAETFLIDGATPRNIALLARLNRLPNRHLIRPGQSVHLPIDRLRLEVREAVVVDHYGAATVDGGPVANGTRVTEGQVLDAGSYGGVRIALPDGSHVWVRETARMRIEALRGAAGLKYDETRLGIESGRLEMLVGKLRGRSRFEVRSPVARLGVRGTEFRAGYEAASRASVVEVLDGTVGAATATSSSPLAADVAVRGGMGLVVDAVRGVGVARPLPAAPVLAALPTLFERPLVTFNLTVPADVDGLRASVRDPRSGHVLASANVTGRALRFADLPDGDWQLIVRARDGAGLEGPEATHAFRLAARPEPPFPSSPRPGQTTRSERVPFAWAEATGARRYRLQVAADATFSRLQLDEPIDGASHLATALPPGDWHWRLASIDATGRQGPFGDPQRFVLRPMPGAPAEPEVAVGMTRFAWPAEPGQAFEFQVARSADFATIERTLRPNEPQVTLTDLAPGAWYMRVRATDPDGYVGPYTSVQRFVVPEPPPPPKGPLWPFLMPLLFLLF